MNILSGTITSSTRYLLRRCINTTRKLKHLAKYELRKQLAETLIFSKLDYADLVCCSPPQFLLRRLQRVQFVAASFVFGHNVKNCRGVLKIGWLPINERRDFDILKSGNCAQLIPLD